MAQIAEIIAFLEGDGYCGSLGDADCVKVVDALMPYAMPNSVCSQLGVCKKNLKTLMTGPTCDECTGSIAQVATVIESEAQIAEIIAFLEGDGYCGSRGDADCVKVVDALMPYAMPALAGLLRERAAQFC